MNSKTRFLSGIMAAAILAAAHTVPAEAHHSFAMFDKSKSVTTEGVVKKVDWRNPHVFVYLDIPDAAGGTKEIALECNSVNLLLRDGWTAKTLKAGDRVPVKYAPLRNGTPGGLLQTIVLPNGKKIQG